ncbi:MAG: hypothetical protein NVV83_05325 [Afipia sp.]|nr:hypothetical protein [Afipia sp.]
MTAIANMFFVAPVCRSHSTRRASYPAAQHSGPAHPDRNRPVRSAQVRANRPAAPFYASADQPLRLTGADSGLHLTWSRDLMANG